jgi:hypothetical protein
VVGCTYGSKGEVPGERKPVIRNDDVVVVVVMMMMILHGAGYYLKS